MQKGQELVASAWQAEAERSLWRFPKPLAQLVVLYVFGFSGRRRARIELSEIGSMESLAAGPEGYFMAITRRQLVVFDVSGQEVTRLHGHGILGGPLLVAPLVRSLVAICDCDSLIVWHLDFSSWTCRDVRCATPHPRASITTAALLPETPLVVTVGLNEELAVLDLLRWVFVAKVALASWVRKIVPLSPWMWLTEHGDQTLVRWRLDVEPGEIYNAPLVAPVGRRDRSPENVFAGAGMLAFWTSDSSLHFLRNGANKILKTVSCASFQDSSGGSGGAVAFSADGTTAAFTDLWGCAIRVVSLLPGDKNAVPFEITSEHLSVIETLEFFPTTSSILASGSPDLTLRIWDVQERACLSTLPGFWSLTNARSLVMLGNGSIVFRSRDRNGCLEIWF